MGKLTITILDASDRVLGDGPIFTVMAASVSEKLDEIGLFSITVQAANLDVVELLTNDNRIQLFEDFVLVAEGFIRERRYGPGSDTGSFVITGPLIMDELFQLEEGPQVDITPLRFA